MEDLSDRYPILKICLRDTLFGGSIRQIPYFEDLSDKYIATIEGLHFPMRCVLEGENQPRSSFSRLSLRILAQALGCS